MCLGKDMVNLTTRGGGAAEFGHEVQWGATVGSGVREDGTGVGCWL